MIRFCARCASLWAALWCLSAVAALNFPAALAALVTCNAAIGAAMPKQ